MAELKKVKVSMMNAIHDLPQLVACDEGFFRAEAHAAEAIQKNPEKHAHYILEEAGGLITMKQLKMWRILNAPPRPYTRDRFNDNYNWTLGWGLVPPGATYETTVDNRAWQ